MILDWTPAQFPRCESGLEAFDGTPLYEAADPAAAVHPMWGTMLYNYESPMVKDFLIGNAFTGWNFIMQMACVWMMWIACFIWITEENRENGHRTSMAATKTCMQWNFWKHLNSIVKKQLPGTLMIAQEDGLWPELTDRVENDHIGFDYKWSGGWTKDLLAYLSEEPGERKNHHDQLTLSMLYAYCEHYVLTLGRRDTGTLDEFMEKLPGSREQKLAQVREAYTYMMLHPGCKMMSPPADMPEGLKNCIQDLNALYKEHPALYEKDDDYDGFEWVQLMKYEENVLTFLRLTGKPEETLLAVCSFSETSHEGYQVGVPFYGKYKEIFNSDQKKYGGAGKVNPRAKTSRREECDEREYSLKLRLPAFSISVFACTPDRKPLKKAAERKPQAKKEPTKRRRR